MRATFRKHSVVYQGRTTPRSTTNKIHFAKQNTMSRAVLTSIYLFTRPIPLGR